MGVLEYFLDIGNVVAALFILSALLAAVRVASIALLCGLGLIGRRID